ncbi:hypothetical protein PC121_g23827, partial [Phytophthora cactorum]
MDQRNNPYGMPGGRGGMPNGMPQQQHYGMQDMMFDPLPMNNGLYHPPPPIHQQHGGMGGLMQQQGMVAPEDDPRFVDDLLGALGNDPAGLGGQQQQQHLGQMPSHVYDQHMMPQHSQAPNFQPGRTQGMPMTSQAPLMQQGGMPGSMHINQMAPNSVGAGGRMGAGMQQQSMGAPAVSSGLGTLGGLGATIPTPPAAPRLAAVAPSAIVPTSTTSKASTSSRALATSSNNGGSSDEDGNLGEDDTQKKKERRRQQVRY